MSSSQRERGRTAAVAAMFEPGAADRQRVRRLEDVDAFPGLQRARQDAQYKKEKEELEQE